MMLDEGTTLYTPKIVSVILIIFAYYFCIEKIWLKDIHIFPERLDAIK